MQASRKKKTCAKGGWFSAMAVAGYTPPAASLSYGEFPRQKKDSTHRARPLCQSETLRIKTPVTTPPPPPPPPLSCV